MILTITFEDNDHKYTVDFLKIAKQLKVSEEDIKKVVLDYLSKAK